MVQEKRKRREESSQDDNSVGEESLSEPPAKRAGLDTSLTIDEQMIAAARDFDGNFLVFICRVLLIYSPN